MRRAQEKEERGDVCICVCVRERKREREVMVVVVERTRNGGGGVGGGKSGRKRRFSMNKRPCISRFKSKYQHTACIDDDELMLNILRCHETY